jgi:long-chain acyl-CoA synthetase
LKIVDRLKDLVKLSHGEYIAVGNLESKYSHSPLVDNICVVGNSHHGAPIALVAPNHNALAALAEEQRLPSAGKGIEELCRDPAVVKAVMKSLAQEAEQNKFEKWEKIAAVQLYPVPWTPESGLLTEAMKLKRHEINKMFKHDIDHLYKNVP